MAPVETLSIRRPQPATRAPHVAVGVGRMSWILPFLLALSGAALIGWWAVDRYRIRNDDAPSRRVGVAR